MNKKLRTKEEKTINELLKQEIAILSAKPQEPQKVVCPEFTDNPNNRTTPLSSSATLVSPLAICSEPCTTRTKCIHRKPHIPDQSCLIPCIVYGKRCIPVPQSPPDEGLLLTDEEMMVALNQNDLQYNHVYPVDTRIAKAQLAKCQPLIEARERKKIGEWLSVEILRRRQLTPQNADYFVAVDWFENFMNQLKSGQALEG